MQAAPLLAVASSLGALLLWTALLGVAALALVLYWPRPFTGPLTEHERRAARQRRRGRSLLVSLATPAATLFGFALLLPPPVALVVESQIMRGQRPSTVPRTSASLLSAVSLRRSLTPWTCSVLRRAQSLAGPRTAPGDEQLRSALVEAAGDGFDGGCEAIDWDALDSSKIVSVELTLVELAARAHLLTSVMIDRGPPSEDPDPWDLAARTLRARGIATTISGSPLTQQGAVILRLGRASLNDESDQIKVLAIVQGDICESRHEGRLFSVVGRGQDPLECEVRPHANACSGTDQRAVELIVTCGAIPPDVRSWVLSAGYAQTLVLPTETTTIPVAGEITDALRHVRENDAGKALADEVRRQGLLPIREAGADDSEQIRVEFAEQAIVVRSTRSSVEFVERAELNRFFSVGSFSWVGFPERPRITCDGHTIEISAPPDLLDPNSDDFAPTAFFSTMRTITWAANALRRGTCGELREPRPVSPLRPRPLLSAQEIDEAVSALSRDRETAGLTLLALALLSLALGLRRSVR